jgi:hypothetical protein
MYKLGKWEQMPFYREGKKDFRDLQKDIFFYLMHYKLNKIM